MIRFLGFAIGNNLANVLNILNNRKFYQIISLKSYEPAGCFPFFLLIVISASKKR